jgi:hypothetical protein
MMRFLGPHRIITVLINQRISHHHSICAVHQLTECQMVNIEGSRKNHITTLLDSFVKNLLLEHL